MADDKTPVVVNVLRGLGEFLKATAPFLTFVTLAAFALLRTHVAFDTVQSPDVLLSLEVSAGGVLFSLLAGYIVKLLFIGSSGGTASSAPEQNGLRDRLARQVVTIGSVGIAIIGLCLIFAIAVKGEQGDVAKSGLSIFTAILPVFSTWVGTVLAFYFTNESFRQAAESTQGLLREGTNDEPITSPGTMIPYDRVIGIELGADEVKAAGGNAAKAAENKPLNDIRNRFTPPGVVRLVVFDDKKIPVYVIRHELMPAIPQEPEEAAKQTLKDYIESETNKDKALNFSWTGKRATITDGRRLFEIRRVTDVFITEHGRSDEPTIGWVTDENIKKANT